MTTNKRNIVLIGMPGSGKSTIGVILAKYLRMEFIDTDILIQSEEETTLQEIVNSHGHMVLREIEERVLLGVKCTNTIIATGGSAAYSAPAMMHLKENGIIVFLHADLPALRKRICNYETRGLAKRPEQSFQDLFAERLELYTRYSDITIKSSEINQEQVVSSIIEKLPSSFLWSKDTNSL